MTETALVVLLMSAGVSHGRAVRLERVLDDHLGGGCGGDWLADILLRWNARQVADMSERLCAMEDAMELFGVYSTTGTQKGGAVN